MTEPADREAPAGPRGAFFGRRKGKKLREGQADLLGRLLPALRIPLPEWEESHVSELTEFGTLTIGTRRFRRYMAPLPALFQRPVRDVHLEIGFGGGEHLVARAAESPDVGFIGCEPFVNGVAKLLREVARADLDNIRVHDRDVAELLAVLPEASIGRAYLLYPDPWPKRRHRKRRFVSDENLAALARVLRPGAEFRFATDIDDYAGWALARVLRSRHFRWSAERAADWREPWPGWAGTRYEAKAVRDGRTPIYLTFVRTDAAG